MSQLRLHVFWESEKLYLLSNDENVLLSMSDAFASASKKPKLDRIV